MDSYIVYELLSYGFECCLKVKKEKLFFYLLEDIPCTMYSNTHSLLPILEVLVWWLGKGTMIWRYRLRSRLIIFILYIL